MNWLAFAFRNVLRNRRRSLVTIVIAAVGTAGMLVGGGFALYTYDSLREAATRESGHVVLAEANYFSRDEDTPMQYGLENAETLAMSVENDPRVRRVLPRVQFSGLISNGEKSSIFMGSGVDAEGEFHTKGPFLKLVAGRLLSTDPQGGPEVVLGQDLARQMKAEPGSGLTLLTMTAAGSLNALDVTVRGLVSVGVPEMDKRLVYVALPTAQQLLQTDKVSTLSVYLGNTDETDTVAADLQARYPDLAQQKWIEQAFYYIGVRGLYNRIFGMLGTVIAVMVLFAVSNTLGMTVVERTREIGTLRAMGTLPAQIVRMFALEGLVLGSAGALLGMVVALGVSLFFTFAGIQMPPPPGRSEGYPLYVNVSLPLYLICAVLVVALSVGAAWFVSRRAATRPITEALGHV